MDTPPSCSNVSAWKLGGFMVKRLGISMLILMLMCTYTIKKNDQIDDAVSQDEKVVEMLTVTSEKLVRCAEAVTENQNSQEESKSTEQVVLQKTPTIQNKVVEDEKTTVDSNHAEGSIQQAEPIKEESDKNDFRDVKMPPKEFVLVVSQEKLGEKNKQTYNEIVSSYYDQLNEIQKMSQESVEEMLEMARQEYFFADEETRTTLEFKREMVMKYYNLANQMEMLVDNTVDETLLKLQKELESGGYTSSVVDQFKTEYEHQKEATMKNIMEHVFTKISLTN